MASTGVLTFTGRGSDIMVPMAIPPFGGMVFVVITMFGVLVPCFISSTTIRAAGLKPARCRGCQRPYRLSSRRAS